MVIGTSRKNYATKYIESSNKSKSKKKRPKQQNNDADDLSLDDAIDEQDF